MTDCEPSRFLQEISDELFTVKREVVDFNPRTDSRDSLVLITPQSSAEVSNRLRAQKDS